MFDDRHSFVSRAFLRGELHLDFKVYAESGEDAVLRARLKEWAARPVRTETQLEQRFIQMFFVDTWGHDDATLLPKLQIPTEGEADLGLGWFRGGTSPADAQVLCEFKDIRSKLDARQNRKGKNRTPVEQCLDYLRGARRGILGAAPTEPRWGLVTDMNEFRLYWWDRAPHEYLRFVISGPRTLFDQYDLLSDSEEAKFDRFLFRKLFERDFLMAQAGEPPLLRLVRRQWIREEKLEGEFYDRYKGVRERLFDVLLVNNADYQSRKSELLRLTQKLLDRFIFAFYCEDMGQQMLFPPQLLRNHMRDLLDDMENAPLGDTENTPRSPREMSDGSRIGGTRVFADSTSAETGDAHAR